MMNVRENNELSSNFDTKSINFINFTEKEDQVHISSSTKCATVSNF